MRLYTTAVLLLASSTTTYAGVAHNNFAPGHGYQSQSGWSVQQNGGSQTVHAMQFVADDGGLLGTIDVAVTHISGPNRITLSLLSSINGVPGATLASWTLNNAMAEYGTNNTPVSITNTDSSLLLSAGTTYWLMASTANGTSAAWNLNSVSSSGLIAQRQNTANWTYFSGQSGAFDLNTVPAPAGLGLLGSSLICFGRRRRSR